MKKIFITKALLFLLYSAFAQTHNEQVTVVAPYQPTVLDAYKININPQTIDSSLTPRETRYDILSRKIITSFGIDPIKPAKVSGEPISKLSPLYVRGGFGNYKTAYGELFYGSNRSSKWLYGAHLKHHSSQGTFLGHQVPFDCSKNQMNIFSEYYGKKTLLSADFYYDRNRHSVYGADTSFLAKTPGFVENQDHRRIYTNIGGKLQISDNHTTQDNWGYAGEINLNAFQSNVNTREIALSMKGNIYQTFDFNHPFFNQTIIGLNAGIGLNKQNVSEFTYQQGDMLHKVPVSNFTMWSLHPFGKLRFSGHDLLVGLKLNLFEEFNGGNAQFETEFQIIPTILAKFNLIDNILAIEFGLDGNAEYATYQKIAERNPFSKTNMRNVYAPELYREYYLGLNTALSKTLDFIVKGRLVSHKNLLNFDAYYQSPYYGIWTPTILTPFLTPIYQDINCFQLQADLNYHLNERIAVSASGRINSYDEEILYKPKYEANLQARYSLQDKIILKTQFCFASGINYSRIVVTTPTPESAPDFNVETFDPTLDWSLNVEYRFNGHWSAFFEWNNILNRKHYDWYNYRTFRTNVLIGVAFKL